MRWNLVWIAALNIVLSRALGPSDDPYKILGVKKSSTVQELRKAYKKLAKEWHPDKNDDPKAAGKFVEITQAYENSQTLLHSLCGLSCRIEELKSSFPDVLPAATKSEKTKKLLSDPERKKKYDNHGIINPDSNQKSKYQFDEFDPFDDIFNFPHGFQFGHQNPDVSAYRKLSITARAFENNLVPKSSTTPHLILFYSDWCFSCMKIEPVWRRVTEVLEPIGIEIATVHGVEEPLLAKKCGVGSVPALVLLINGKTYPFKESLYNFQKIVDFVRSKFPYKLISNVNDDNLKSFLEGWHDNRVRALIFGKSETVRLRYLLMAFYYRERVLFGFVRLGSADSVEIQKKFKVSPELDTLLLFNENTIRPVASLSMSVIPVQTMKDVITANKYLILPRLSSQKVLDSVCPIEWATRKKRLCIVLISENTKEHDESRQVMRQFAQESSYNSDRVRFSYIYQERQQEFVNSLLSGTSRETVLNVVILWRRDVNHVKYEWLQGSWSFGKASPEWNKTKEKLESTIAKLLKTDETLTYEAVVKELIDEQAQGIVGKIISRFLIAADIVRDHVNKDHVLAGASVAGTVLFIVLGGYFMAYLLRQEEEKIKFYQKRNGYQQMNNNDKCNGSVSYTPQLRLHELRAEKYNGMVRLLKPGCRTIVLLLDFQSRNSLLREFHAVVWPYRKNKTLMFGYMSIDKGLEWYRRLLNLSLPEPRDLDINPRNCIGTVLSLNGHRKYFCMYHAKHPERFKGRGSRRMVKMTKALNSNANAVNKIGSFMGFEDSSDSESEEDLDVEQGNPVLNEDENGSVLFESNLLKDLPNWLDRLFEGTTHRYYINYWPDFPTK